MERSGKGLPAGKSMSTGGRVRSLGVTCVAVRVEGSAPGRQEHEEKVASRDPSLLPASSGAPS